MMKCRGMGMMDASKMPRNTRKVTALKKGGSVKDACYRKVKKQYKVFPPLMRQGL